MDAELMLDVGQANELKLAFRRAGWSNGDIKKLCEGDILSRLLPIVRGNDQFKVFKTIKLGTGPKTADDFSQALKENGCEVSNWVKDILGKPGFTVASQETEVDLVVVSVAELGFKEGATRKDIYKRAKELGLALCPAEVGPQLRLQYKDQPKGEWLLIGMEPITDSDGDLFVFFVARDVGGLWLGSSYGGPEGRWRAGACWVFCRRK